MKKFTLLAAMFVSAICFFNGNAHAQLLYSTDSDSNSTFATGFDEGSFSAFASVDLGPISLTGTLGGNSFMSFSMGSDIYRGGGKTAKNLTPRPKDTDGLSATTTKPDKGWELKPKKDLEDLGFEVINDPTEDDAGHVLIKPGKKLRDQGHTLENWQDSREDIDEDNEDTWHPLTKLLYDNATPVK
jgi:hypothetical protein